MRACCGAPRFKTGTSSALLAPTAHSLTPQHHTLYIQVTKYVEREIINHRDLVHPHIVQFKEVRSDGDGGGH